MVFIDLEKAFDRVPRELIWHALSAQSVPEYYIMIVKDMYNQVSTKVRSQAGTSDEFEVKVYADDVVIISEYVNNLQQILEKWREALETSGLRISREKTEYMHCNFSGVNSGHTTCLQNTQLKEVDHFKYLGSVISKDGSIDTDVTHRINAGWKKSSEPSGVLCDS